MSLLKQHRNQSPLFVELDNMIEDFLKETWYGVQKQPSQHSNTARHPIDFQFEDDRSFKIEFDVQGVSKDDIVIDYDSKLQTIFVSSKSQEKTDNNKVSRYFNYNLELPDADVSSLEAACENGVLTITGKPIEKKANRTRIQIK